MTFGTITIGAATFNEAGPGRYFLETVGFGDPQDLLIISGGAHNKKTGITTAAITRSFEKDVADATDQLAEAVRRKCTVSMVIQAPYGVTTTEIDTRIAQISNFVDTANLSRILLGEQ